MPETPYHAYINHMHLVDLHRQHGPADYWITVAPGLYHFPQHMWVENQIRITGARISRSPVAEATHMSHCLREIMGKFLLSGKVSPFYDPVHHQSTITAWSEVTEFQEGTRMNSANAAKPGVPGREGTGAEHKHIILWAPHAERSVLSNVLRADLPGDDTVLREAVERYQLSHVSDLPVHECATHWKPIWERGKIRGWQLVILHSQEASSMHVRAYMVPLLLSRIGHMDVQVIRSTADVSAYTSVYLKYSTKYSMALDADALEKQCNGLQAGYALLQHLQAGAAQMLSSLSHGSLYRMSCSTKEC